MTDFDLNDFDETLPAVDRAASFCESQSLPRMEHRHGQ